MSTVQTQIRIDPQVKSDATLMFKNLGLDLSTAINIFLRQALYEGGLPFSVKQKKINKKTMKAIEEAELIKKDPDAKVYDTVNELESDLDQDA